jgi:ADP-heptose:LPS heptosyltransferase
MHTHLMRKIDYYVGIPLCWLITILYRLQRLLGFKNPRYHENPAPVLFIELAEMGSTVLAYPAMQALKARYPTAQLYFVIFKHIKECVEISNLIPTENLFFIESVSLWSILRDTIKFALASRRKKIDTAIVLEIFARYSTILSYLSGARKRVGFYRYHQEGLYIGTFLSHKVHYNPHIHTAHAFLSLVYALDAPHGQVPLTKVSVEDHPLTLPVYHSSVADRARIWHLLQEGHTPLDHTKQLVIVNPNASPWLSIRRWPLTSYTALVKRLLTDEDLYVVIIGVASEQPEAAYLRQAVQSDRLLDLTGKTALPDLLHLFNLGAVLITNDSGPAHFAARTSIHTVVFFGPETPTLYRPLGENCTVMYAHYACSPCVSAYNQRLSPCQDNVCLQSISVDEVYRTVRSILRQTSLPRPLTLRQMSP